MTELNNTRTVGRPIEYITLLYHLLYYCVYKTGVKFALSE